MRALAVALLLSVPLTAGDNSSLEKAVELFRSPDAGKRAAGSQLAERELRKFLAPLLEAMEDGDPEVRRRARRSVLSLVPGEVEKEKAAAEVRKALRTLVSAKRPQAPVQVSAAFHALARWERTFPLSYGRVRRERRAYFTELEQEGLRLMQDFGIKISTKRPAAFTSGFVVAGVRKDSAAGRLGIRTGDFIVRIKWVVLGYVHDFARALRDKREWSRIKVMVSRDGRRVCLPKK